MTKIGVFDSGLGGLQTLQYLRKYMPEYDYVFLADTANSPYGEKSGETIRELTFKALRYLFDTCKVELVILACNTAAAYAVRDRQMRHPEKKVLSVTIPGVEAMIEGDGVYKNIGVLMTPATMQSGVYPYLFGRFGGMGSSLSLVSAPNVVPAIESGMTDVDQRKKVLTPYMAKFDANLDALVLGCTHYPLWKTEIQSFFDIPIIDPGEESAKKLIAYLERHPEIKDILSTGSSALCLVTGESKTFENVAENLWGEKIKVEEVNFED